MASISVGHDAPVTNPALRILERPVYGMSEAADLLGLRADRARAWLEGYERQGARYPPVIRAEPTGDDIVTWGEFVELGYLREYRRKGVPLQRLRPVIDELRRAFETPYPLATAKPYVFGKELVLELQEKNDIPPAIAIVIRSGQQIMLADDAQRFLRKVEFEPPNEGDVRRLHPAGPASPVVIDPSSASAAHACRASPPSGSGSSSTPASPWRRLRRDTTLRPSWSERRSRTRSSGGHWRHSGPWQRGSWSTRTTSPWARRSSNATTTSSFPAIPPFPRFLARALTTSGLRLSAPGNSLSLRPTSGSATPG